MKIGTPMGMNCNQPDNNYSDNLLKGLEFQDFVAVQFAKIGISITNFSSKKFQYDKGENLQGFEIKYDMKFRTTGNFWIEVKEKRKAENPNWINSGIFRPDNTIFYVIGDYGGVYIMQKKVLRSMASRFSLIENLSKTSIGFLLPVDNADKYFDYKKF